MWVKILLLFFVFSFLFRSDTSFDQDLGRHLKLGEIIVNTWGIPKTNLFSYTNPNFPFVNTHWLFEVMVFEFNQTIGLQWMLILKIILILLSVWLTIKTIPKENRVLLLPIGFIFLHVLRERLELRPEIFSFLFTAITLYILEKFTSKQVSSDRGTNVLNIRLVFALPIIQLIWVNTHIYFFIGLMLQAIFILHLFYQKLRSHPRGAHTKFLNIIFMLSVIVSFINPNGLQGLLYPLNVSKNYGYTIVENQTLFFLENIKFSDPNFLFVKLSVAIIGLSIVVALIRRQFQLKNILLALSGVGLALMHVRSFPYLVFLSLPAVIQNFGVMPWKNLGRILTFITISLLLLETFFYFNGDYYKYRSDPHKPILKNVESYKSALDFVISHDLPNPIFNNFDIGSYILYRGYPKYQVYVDGRPEAYPKEFFQGEYIPSQADYNNFKKLDEFREFKTVIFSHTDQTPWGRTFIQNIVKDESWKLVYVDDFIIVSIKGGLASELRLNHVDLSTLSPANYKFTDYLPYLRIGLFLLSTGHTDSGTQFIQKAQQIFPQSPFINKMLGNPTSSYFIW